MKRKGWVATARNAKGQGFDSHLGTTVKEVIEAVGRNGKITTISEEFSIHLEPFEWEDESCDMCHLSLDHCNCEMIGPDPHPHLVLVKENPN